MNKKSIVLSLLISLYSYQSLAMEDDFLDREDLGSGEHVSVKPMKDKKLEKSIKLHAPKFVKPSFWQSVEVLQPSKPWQKYCSSALSYGKEPYLAYEFKYEKDIQKLYFVDKWIFPSTSLFGPSMDSLVTFREDKTEVMLRRDAYAIMKYENDEISELRTKLYDLEKEKLDYEQGTYDGMTFYGRNTVRDPEHPEIFNLWEEANTKNKEKQKKLEKMEKERGLREYEQRPEVQQKRQEEERRRKLEEEERKKRELEEQKKREKAYQHWRMEEWRSGDLDRQLKAGWHQNNNPY